MKKFSSICVSTVLAAALLGGCGQDATSEVTAQIIDLDLTSEEYAFGVDKSQPELLDQVNDFIARVKEDGTLDEICEKYFGNGTPTPVKSAALDTSKDQLIVATNAAFEPFEYLPGEDYYGIDMELAALLAEELGQELVIQNMDFDAVCLSVGQQKCDIAMAGLTISEDRKEYVNFSDPYYSASQRLIVRSDDETFKNSTDIASIESILSGMDKNTKIGVQAGTTGQSYLEGNPDLGFDGFPVTCVTYKNGSLAVQDLLNGNLNYVIIDSAPATCITESINKMR